MPAPPRVALLLDQRDVRTEDRRRRSRRPCPPGRRRSRSHRRIVDPLPPSSSTRGHAPPRSTRQSRAESHSPRSLALGRALRARMFAPWVTRLVYRHHRRGHARRARTEDLEQIGRVELLLREQALRERLELTRASRRARASLPRRPSRSISSVLVADRLLDLARVRHALRPLAEEAHLPARRPATDSADACSCRRRSACGATRRLAFSRSSDAPVEISPKTSLLGGAPAEQRTQAAEQLVLRHQVAILERRLQRVAEHAAAARHDRHLLHRVGAGREVADQRVARLVVGDDPALARLSTRPFFSRPPMTRSIASWKSAM